MSAGVAIAGLGHYAPERRVPNSEIEARLGVEAGWIERRTGIAARRFAADDEALTDFAINAGGVALERAGVARDDVALLLLATSTPDHLLPPSAPLVAHRLGLKSAGAVDLAGACAGFIYALVLADAFVRARQAPALVIAGNILSRRMNFADRASSALFADAAGAAMLIPSERANSGVIGAHLVADGAGYDLIKIEGGGSRTPFARLADAEKTLMAISDGQAVYQEAVEMMASAARTALTKAGLSPRDVDCFVPHQANARMMAAVCRQLEIPAAKMRSSIREYANSSAATIPLTLALTAPAEGYAQGDIVLMTAAGAGMTGGAAVLRW